MSREFDAVVAEKVMGWPMFDGSAHEEGSRPYPHCWKRWTNRPDFFVYDGHGNIDFKPTTEATWDYSVLVHVREKWSRDQRYEYEIALNRLLDEYPGLTPRASEYRPGMYSLAALLAKEVVTTEAALAALKQAGEARA